jgi:hypothetical protein
LLSRGSEIAGHWFKPAQDQHLGSKDAQDVDVVIDAVGGPHVERFLTVIKLGGALSLVNPLGFLGRDEAATRGIMVSSTQVRSNGGQLTEAGRWLNDGTSRVVIDSVYPLAEHQLRIGALLKGASPRSCSRSFDDLRRRSPTGIRPKGGLHQKESYMLNAPSENALPRRFDDGDQSVSDWPMLQTYARPSVFGTPCILNPGNGRRTP